MCTTVRLGTEDEFEQVLAESMQADDSSIETALLSGLACTREQYLLVKLLEKVLYRDEILAVLATAALNPNGYLVSWQFFKSEWNYIYNK